ncbi:hypothetical protein TNCV_4751141 [Trichonephila clavipes]|nr:hypothetical protein TNCV_4751141 [Trichonephila clavipes]
MCSAEASSSPIGEMCKFEGSNQLTQISSSTLNHGLKLQGPPPIVFVLLHSEVHKTLPPVMGWSPDAIMVSEYLRKRDLKKNA